MSRRRTFPSKSAGETLYLNVYDLTPYNGYMYWIGFGIFHSAVEAYGVEYAFGAHDYPTSGVFEVEPRSCPGYTFRRAIPLGTIQISPKDLRQFMVQIASEYNGDSYHLIAKNCNHFCDDVSTRLTGSSIPGWVNRLARLGALCNCVLPDSLHLNNIQHTPEYENNEGERNSPTGTCVGLADHFATVATRKTHLSVSSSFLQSLKEGAVPCKWKSSNVQNKDSDSYGTSVMFLGCIPSRASIRWRAFQQT